MSTHPTELELHDYSDGTLGEPRRATVRAHLESCATCAADAQRIAQLLSEVRALPREVAPPQDLLSGINARIDALHPAAHGATPDAGALDTGGVLPLPHAASARRAPRDARRLPVRWLAAAAVLLVALSSATTVLVLQRTGGARHTAEPLAGARPAYDSPAATRLVAVQVLERSYLDAIAELQGALADPQVALSPETVRLLRENLQIIDLALAESRAALLADPASPALAELLRAGYERKLDLLRTAGRQATIRARG